MRDNLRPLISSGGTNLLATFTGVYRATTNSSTCFMQVDSYTIFYTRVALHVFVNVQSKVSFITFAEGMGRIVPIPFFNLGANCGWAVSAKPRAIYFLGRASLSIVKEAGGLRFRSAWVRKIWPFFEVLSSNFLARSESVY